MAHLPCLPVLVFVFLVVHVQLPASHAGPLPPTYDGSMCSDSYRCGSVDIRYPFYLDRATRQTADYTTYSCGYTDLRISCREDGNTDIAIIQLGQYDYTVTDISYGTGRQGSIHLADADAFRGGDCPTIRHNFTFSEEWLHKTASDDNLTFFFSCDLSKDVLQMLGEYRIDCLGFSNSPRGGEAFVFPSEQHGLPGDHDIAEQCDEIVVVPILRESVVRMSNRSVLGSEYGSVLRYGFELAWSGDTAGDCNSCEQSGGRCAYSQYKLFLGCLCSDEKGEARYCSRSSCLPEQQQSEPS